MKCYDFKGKELPKYYTNAKVLYLNYLINKYIYNNQTEQ